MSQTIQRFVTQRLAPTNHRLRMMIARGKVTAGNSATRQQELQVSLLPGEVIDGIEHVEPYGFTSAPLDGAEVVVLFPGGDRSHGVVLTAGDRRHRPQGRRAGEVQVYDNQGQFVKLVDEGIFISSPSGKKIEFQIGNTILTLTEAGITIVTPKLDILES